MRISSRQVYDADPTTVVTMLCQKAFLEELGRRAGATGCAVEVAGYTTHVAMQLPPPEGLARFTGSRLAIRETVGWGDPAPDGSRQGTLRVDVEGMPVDLAGTAVVRREGATTIVEYEGELIVRIPLVGRQVEQLAAPAITDAFDVQQQLGTEWLDALA